MNVSTVLKKNEAAWQEVSLHWKDEMHQKYAQVQSQLNDILQCLNKTCMHLEAETDRVKGIFYGLENL